MQWVDLILTVQKENVDAAADIAVELSEGGIYVEDYSDLATQAPQIAPMSFVADELLQKQNEDVIIHLYLPPEKPPQGLISLLKSKLAQAGIAHTITTAFVQQEDWETSWKAYYHPMEIGHRLMLCPAWEQAPSTQRTVLKLDPGMAFGTGTHETTALCLRALDELVRPGMKVLDIGCGSGILGIAACLLGAQGALGIDIDPVAVRTANENAERNDILGPFTAVQGDLADKAEEGYDLVLANILAGAIISLAPVVPPLLAKDGVFISSGIIEEKEEAVKAALESAGLAIMQTTREKGWVCIWAKIA
ncbi:50S ribosomal protein L11 methyltransferase [Ruminococcaceae bacterium OttesenSCG-928-N02]|nr:50S ribosomal protein L11 methyltransferase [Ruminococcaceae bacterium OttesenSCG-928-N02]